MSNMWCEEPSCPYSASFRFAAEGRSVYSCDERDCMCWAMGEVIGPSPAPTGTIDYEHGVFRYEPKEEQRT